MFSSPSAICNHYNCCDSILACTYNVCTGILYIPAVAARKRVFLNHRIHNIWECMGKNTGKRTSKDQKNLSEFICRKINIFLRLLELKVPTFHSLFVNIIVKTTLVSCKPISYPYEAQFMHFVKISQFEQRTESYIFCTSKIIS